MDDKQILSSLTEEQKRAVKKREIMMLIAGFVLGLLIMLAYLTHYYSKYKKFWD